MPKNCLNEMQTINPDLLIQYLNSLVALDAYAISKLIDYRVPVNKALTDHETVQILQKGTEENPEYCVGLLGILNGLCGVDEDGWGYIVAVCDTDNNISKFIHKKDRNK